MKRKAQTIDLLAIANFIHLFSKQGTLMRRSAVLRLSYPSVSVPCLTLSMQTEFSPIQMSL